MKLSLLILLTSLSLIGYGQFGFDPIVTNQFREVSFTPTGHIFADHYFLDEAEIFTNDIYRSDLKSKVKYFKS